MKRIKLLIAFIIFSFCSLWAASGNIVFSPTYVYNGNTNVVTSSTPAGTGPYLGGKLGLTYLDSYGQANIFLSLLGSFNPEQNVYLQQDSLFPDNDDQYLVFSENIWNFIDAFNFQVTLPLWTFNLGKQNVKATPIAMSGRDIIGGNITYKKNILSKETTRLSQLDLFIENMNNPYMENQYNLSKHLEEAKKTPQSFFLVQAFGGYSTIRKFEKEATNVSLDDYTVTKNISGSQDNFRLDSISTERSEILYGAQVALQVDPYFINGTYILNQQDDDSEKYIGPYASELNYLQKSVAALSLGSFFLDKQIQTSLSLAYSVVDDGSNKDPQYAVQVSEIFEGKGLEQSLSLNYSSSNFQDANGIDSASKDEIALDWRNKVYLGNDANTGINFKYKRNNSDLIKELATSHRLDLGLSYNQSLKNGRLGLSFSTPHTFQGDGSLSGFDTWSSNDYDLKWQTKYTKLKVAGLIENDLSLSHNYQVAYEGGSNQSQDLSFTLKSKLLKPFPLQFNFGLKVTEENYKNYFSSTLNDFSDRDKDYDLGLSSSYKIIPGKLNANASVKYKKNFTVIDSSTSNVSFIFERNTQTFETPLKLNYNLNSKTSLAFNYLYALKQYQLTGRDNTDETAIKDEEESYNKADAYDIHFVELVWTYLF